MSEKQTDRGVVASIRALRERRYMERGPGAKHPASKLSADELRDAIARVPEKLAKRSAKKKTKKVKKPRQK